MNTVTRASSITLPFLSGRVSLLLLMGLVLFFTLLMALAVGAVSIPLSALFSGRLSAQDLAVITSIRLPRVLLSAIVGAALAVSGASMQSLFRNPLADPGVIGIASGAALAVAMVIVLAGPLSGVLALYSLSLAAFTGGLVTCLLIFRFTGISGAFSATYMLLAGIAINTLSGAATGFLTYLSDDQQLRALTFWSMGSFGGALWPAVLVATTIVLPATYLLLRNARALNILLLGDEEARYLGVDSRNLQRRVILCTALSVGAAVAVSGIIGFVGLVVPHLIRLTLGPDNRFLLPASALLGALLLVLADTLARTLVAPAELPVGILTSLIGGPFFLWLLIKQFAGRMGL